jgi:hypothetical protein
MVHKTEYVIPHGGPLKKRLKEFGTHIHHIAYQVTTFDGFQDLILDKPVKGIQNMMVNFIDPTKYGILIELVVRT